MTVHVVELSPLKASALRWLPQRGGAVVTVVCKATFPLAQGRVELAPAQDDVNERDLHTENNPKKGLYSASDLVPFKRQPDVTLVGRCFAKPGELSKMLLARLRVADVDKRIEVHADRYFGRDGKLVDDAFFSKMALGYERAAGGPGTDNPVGVDTRQRPRDDGRVPAPNLQRPGEMLARPAHPLTPTGFGPIPAAWRARSRLLTGPGEAWLEADWLQARVPAEWDWRYFNVAPVDQRPRALRDDEELHLQHLHPEHPELSMRLPGLRPCVYLEQGGQARPLQLQADTLWIDTNRLVVTVCWRGRLEVADAPPVRALVAMTRPGEQLSFAEVMALARKVHRRRAEQQEQAASEAKTQVRPGRASSPGAGAGQPRMAGAGAGQPRTGAGQPRMTSPVPLVPSNDMAPAWLPPPSSNNLGAAKRPGAESNLGAENNLGGQSHGSSGHALELSLSAEELQLARQLAGLLGCSLEDALRHALRDSHYVRFKRS